MKKFVLVTGASGGIGYATTVQLCRAGYSVFACDLNAENDEKLLSMSKRAKSKKADDNQEYVGQVVPINIDITDDAKIAKAKEVIMGQSKVLFAILNNAGIMKMDTLIDGDIETFRKIVEINFWGMHKINRAFFDMLKKDESIIINVSSETAGYSVPPFNAYYALSKHLVDAYSDALRRELMFEGIKVVKIRAGSFKTNMLEDTKKQYKKMAEGNPKYEAQLSKMQNMMMKELQKNNSPYLFGDLVVKILNAKKPKFLYRIKNSPSQKLLGMLPEKMQDMLYFKMLSKKEENEKIQAND